MKRLFSSIRNRYLVLLMTPVLILFIQATTAQVCSDPTNIVYGLTNTGIHPITLGTGNVGAEINPIYGGNPGSNSNGVGYSPLNGKFYFFKRSPSSTPQEFVSFDPSTNALTILSNCPTTYSVYIGCVTADGASYYCWDSQSRLFYYNIAANTWTLITTTLVDQFGNDVDAVFRAHGSGDVAADGNGRLLMLPSSISRYALYRMNAPLPKTPVASITVTQIVPLTMPPAKFVGIALNITGQIILNTSAPTNRLYRLENNLTLTFLSNLTLEIGDMTSCNFPFAILPLSIKNFSTTSKNNGVLLKWDITESNSGVEYFIEHSSNGINWGKVGHIKETTPQPFKSISFTHTNPEEGKNYYRIRMLAANTEEKYSEVKTIVVEKNISISVWPNPVQNTLWIRNNVNSTTISKASIFDQSGRKIKDINMMPGMHSIDMKNLAIGGYIVTVQLASGENHTYKIFKEK